MVRTKAKASPVATTVKREVKLEAAEVKVESTPISTSKRKTKNNTLKKDGESPFPTFNRPHVEDCLQVAELLTAMHGIKEIQNSVRPVLDALVRTILSQNTTDRTSMVAFQNLKAAFPTWKSVMTAANADIEDAIRCGGLAEIKVRASTRLNSDACLGSSPMSMTKLQTKRIKIILQDIIDNYSEFCVNGEPSLEWMRALSTADVKAKLTAYDGVGPKVSPCTIIPLDLSSLCNDLSTRKMTEALQLTVISTLT